MVQYLAIGIRHSAFGIRHSAIKILAILLLSVVAVLAPVSPADAQVSLALSTDAPDLNSLAIGQTFTVDVQLSGIAAGQTLDSLLGSVLFESDFLSIPTVSAGPIVPNPSDFFATDFAGQADGAFLTFGTNSADHITTDGTFFSFVVTPIALGSGTFSFDSFGLDATAFNPANPASPLPLSVDSSAPLAFAVTVVPEPATLDAGRASNNRPRHTPALEQGGLQSRKTTETVLENEKKRKEPQRNHGNDVVFSSCRGFVVVQFLVFSGE